MAEQILLIALGVLLGLTLASVADFFRLSRLEDLSAASGYVAGTADALIALSPDGSLDDDESRPWSNHKWYLKYIVGTNVDPRHLQERYEDESP